MVTDDYRVGAVTTDNQPTPPVRVVLIEDDAEIARAVEGSFQACGFSVTWAGTLGAGREALSREACDALVLDVGLPDGNGMDFAAELREAGEDIPIVMLTARDSVPDRIEGLRRGADDYVCKPFEMGELLARLRALLRRARGPDRHVLRYADVELDLLTRTARRQELCSVLSARETDLLGFLLSHPEEVLTRERLLENVWREEAEEDSNVVNVYVNYLRNKIERGRLPRIIHTVRGMGYVLSDREPDALARGEWRAGGE